MIAHRYFTIAVQCVQCRWFDDAWIHKQSIFICIRFFDCRQQGNGLSAAGICNLLGRVSTYGRPSATSERLSSRISPGSIDVQLDMYIYTKNYHSTSTNTHARICVSHNSKNVISSKQWHTMQTNYLAVRKCSSPLRTCNTAHWTPLEHPPRDVSIQNCMPLHNKSPGSPHSQLQLFKRVSLCSTTGCESHAAKQELPLWAGPEEHGLRRNWKRMG